MIDRVICYGTLWVEPTSQTEETLTDAQPSPGAPHMTSPDLDGTFVTNLFVHCTGKTWKELIASHMNELASGHGERDTVSLITRVGGSPHTCSDTYHLFDCTETFCRSVSDLTDERVREIAANWRGVYSVSAATPADTEAPSHLLSVLTRLVELARTAVAEGTRLRLRVDYREERANQQ